MVILMRLPPSSSVGNVGALAASHHNLNKTCNDNDNDNVFAGMVIG